MITLAAIRNTVHRIFAGEQPQRADPSAYPRKIAVAQANGKTVSFIKEQGCRCIAEIGIYEGHTSLEIANYLNNEGELHLYDFADRVALVEEKLRAAGFSNVQTFGSSYKFLDSYNWPLAKVIEKNSKPIYDYVFMDGAHTWAIDALTFFLVDRLLMVGGYVDFDDYDWSLDRSLALRPKAFPFTAQQYTQEQIEAEQVKMIIDLIVRRDGRYREVVENKIFQKIR